MQPETNRVAIYRRVSKDDQNNSLEAQEAANMVYCERMGLATDVQTFADEDTSGGVLIAQRPGGAALLRWVDVASQSGAPVHVITSKQDRLGRDTLDLIATVRGLWERGVIPHFTLEGGPFPRTPQNELMLEIKASVAQYERNLIRERTTTVLHHKARQGKLIGTVPYGWDALYTFADQYVHASNRALNFAKDPEAITLTVAHGAVTSHTVVRNATEHGIITQVRQYRAAGSSLKAIAKHLNDRGIKAKLGGAWSAGNVAKLLKPTTLEKQNAHSEKIETTAAQA